MQQQEQQQQEQQEQRGKQFTWMLSNPERMAVVDHSEPRSKRRRRMTSKEEQAVLEATFLRNPRPSAQERSQLAQQTGMTMRSIQVWFQNRRSHAKKQGLAQWRYAEQLAAHALLDLSSSSSSVQTAVYC